MEHHPEHKPKRGPGAFRRRRCHNCNELYQPDQAKQRFCSDECRKEFHHHGSAFGPLRDKLEKMIEKTIRAEINSVMGNIRELRAQMAKLEGRVDAFGDLQNSMVLHANTPNLGTPSASNTSRRS